MKLSILLVASSLALTPLAMEAQGVTAFKTGEHTTGQTKQCYYAFGGKEYTKTVEAYQLCPLSIEVMTPPTPDRSPMPSPSTTTAFKTGENTTPDVVRPPSDNRS